jgi:hypothetical protein
MVTKPFFLFKNRPFQSHGPYSGASINVKTGSPDPADFAKTRRLLPRLWHIALKQLQYAKVAQTMARTANICQLVFCANCHKSVIHFFAALAVRAMVVRPWHITAAES